MIPFKRGPDLLYIRTGTSSVEPKTEHCYVWPVIEEQQDHQSGKRNLMGKLTVIFVAMFVAQAVGSIFNIKYNLVHISPLLSEAQSAAFQRSINIFNALAYPLLVGIWAFLVFRLNKRKTSPGGILKQQRAVINLPILSAVIASSGWLFCIPALFIGLKISGEKINPHVFFHFPVSVVIAMIISLAIGYFTIDWLRQKYLFPHFFQHISPSQIKGAHALSISGRGKVWTIAASICPIISLLLLLISPSEKSNFWFALLYLRRLQLRCIPFALSSR